MKGWKKAAIIGTIWGFMSAFTYLYFMSLVLTQDSPFSSISFPMLLIYTIIAIPSFIISDIVPNLFRFSISYPEFFSILFFLSILAGVFITEAAFNVYLILKREVVPKKATEKKKYKRHKK